MSALVALRTDGGLLGAILSDFFRGVGDVKGEEGSCWWFAGSWRSQKKFARNLKNFRKCVLVGALRTLVSEQD